MSKLSSLSAALSGLGEVSPSQESLATPNISKASQTPQKPLPVSGRAQDNAESDFSDKSIDSLQRSKTFSEQSLRRNSSPFSTASGSRASLARSNSIQVSVKRKQSAHATSPVTAASYASCVSSPATSFLSQLAQSTTPSFKGIYQEGDQIHHYTLESEIGVGASSRVVRARHSSDAFPSPVAIKILNRSHLSEAEFKQASQQLFKETDLWATLHHPHIVQMYQVMEAEHSVFVVSELTICTLFQFIKENGPLTESQSKRIFQQIVSAVEYLHSMKIVHRDIKCENILLARRNDAALDTDICNLRLGADYGKIDEYDVKLADFGLSQNFSEIGSSAPVYCVGTLNFCPPEEITQRSTNLVASDIWALGCVLYALLTAKLPFNDDFLPRLQYSIINGNFDTDCLCKLSESTRALIHGILNVDTKQRLTIEQILNHEWFFQD